MRPPRCRRRPRRESGRSRAREVFVRCERIRPRQIAGLLRRIAAKQGDSPGRCGAVGTCSIIGSGSLSGHRRPRSRMRLANDIGESSMIDLQLCSRITRPAAVISGVTDLGSACRASVQQHPGPIRAAHQRPGGHGAKTHCSRLVGPCGKLFRRHESIDRQESLARSARRQVLAERQHIDVAHRAAAASRRSLLDPFRPGRP